MTINYTAAPEWHQNVLRHTSGEGVNVVLEMGGQGTINRSVASTGAGGSIAILGGFSGFGGEVSPATLLTGAKSMVGFLPALGSCSNSKFVLFTEPD